MRKTFQVTRGMLTWKLELTQTTNAYIRTAKTGYTIVSRTAGDDSVQVVKVLQIMGNNNEWGGYFNLSQDRDMQDFISNFENTEGVRFEITAIQCAISMANIHPLNS